MSTAAASYVKVPRHVAENVMLRGNRKHHESFPQVLGSVSFMNEEGITCEEHTLSVLGLTLICLMTRATITATRLVRD